MAYQIDFTASNYARRSRRKVFLRLLLLAGIAAVAWGIRDCYITYNQPTLNMRLADYEAVARPIEEMNRAWDDAAKEYNALARYYRLVWAANATNFLSAMASDDAPRLGRGFRPVSWTLTTGGNCALSYHFAFGPGDRAEQAKGLENQVVGVVTSAVQVVGGRVDVQGVKHEDLLIVPGFDVKVLFALSNISNFPAKAVSLSGCVDDIVKMRKNVQELKLENEGSDTRTASTIPVNALMTQYLPMGKDKGGFPDIKAVIDVAGWFGLADQFIAKNSIPVDEQTRLRLKATWNRIGEARFPWERYRALDNEELVQSTKVLSDVSDGVRRFKVFLEKRHADCQKKLEPFVDAYLADKVFNNPVIVPDLRDRVAGGAGIRQANVPTPTRADEIKTDPSVLVTKDDRFTFTWVKWTLQLGSGENKDRAGSADEEDADARLTIQKVADCARRVQELGPGYAIESVQVNFGADGNVSGAVLKGLVPVKKVEKLMKGVGNVR